MDHSMHNMSTTTMSHMHHMNTSGTTMGMEGMDHNGMDHNGMDHNGMDHDGMDHNGMNHSDGCMGGMMMYFHTGKCEFILFETLKTKDDAGIIGACVAIFFLAILYEGLKVLREYLLQKAMLANMGGKYAMNGASMSSSSRDAMVISNKNVGVHMMSCGHFIQTLLHMLQVLISYCLMLIFMTYNVWLCLAVILGAGVGYFLFGWRKAIVVDINEHCH